MKGRRIVDRFLPWLYAIGDFIAGAIAWTALYAYRKVEIEKVWDSYYGNLLGDANYMLGVVLVPLFWMGLYAVMGMYSNPRRRHKAQEFVNILISTSIGSLLLFFSLLIDDYIVDYNQYYMTLGVLFISHLSLTLTSRLIIVSRTLRLIEKGDWAFKTLVLGGSDTAVQLVYDIQTNSFNSVFELIGFIQINDVHPKLSNKLQRLGGVDDLVRVIDEYNIEEVIVAIEPKDRMKTVDLIVLSDQITATVGKNCGGVLRGA